MKNPGILVLTFDRVQSLNSTLSSLLKVDGIEDYPVYISQDGFHVEIKNLVRTKFPNFYFWQRERIPLLSKTQEPQAYIAQHYKYALDKIFLEYNHSHAIILEDGEIKISKGI